MTNAEYSYEDPKYADQVKIIKTQLAIKQIKAISIISIIGGLLLIAILWKHTIPTNAIIWIIFVLIVYTLISPLLLHYFNKVPATKLHMRPYQISLIALSFIRGITWGSTAFFLDTPDSPIYQIGILAFTSATAAIAAITNTTCRYGAIVQITTILAPFLIKFLLELNLTNILISICLVFYLIILVYFNGKMNKSITSMLYLQHALEEQKNAAEQAKNAQTQFLATASHDLRQPLHAHGLLVSALKKKTHEPESQRILGVLESSMHSMHSLLNSLLDISKLDAGAIDPEIIPFRILPLLDQIFLDYEPEANSKNLKFAFRSVDAVVLSDKHLVERILRNLISNAVNYTSHGAILVIARYRNRKLRIEVRDSGPGIAPSDQDVIFQEFKQLPLDANEQCTGLGLGLAIVQRLAKLLNINIELQSNINCGSTFSLELPLANIKTDVPQKDDIKNPLTGKNDAKILIIDDDQTIQFAMCNLLEKYNFSVKGCASYREVETLLNSEDFTPDVILVDYRLQGETGVELVDKLKSKYKFNSPVIIITGDTAADKLLDIQHSGYIVLHKPVEPDNLLKQINKLI